LNKLVYIKASSIGAYSCGPSGSRYHWSLFNKLTDRQRLTILDDAWAHTDDFVWPYTERMDSGKLMRKYLGKQHISGAYGVFAYSALKKGLLCKECVLFAPHEAVGVTLDRLVKSPL
ncbi:hypothetical protein LSAT2_014994, partial [Lamellibrachia satsuma]